VAPSIINHNAKIGCSKGFNHLPFALTLSVPGEWVRKDIFANFIIKSSTSTTCVTLFRTLFSSKEEYANDNDELKGHRFAPLPGQAEKSLNGPFLFAIDFAFNGFVKFTSATQTPTTDYLPKMPVVI
jgi:hypothetical protein